MIHNSSKRVTMMLCHSIYYSLIHNTYWIMILFVADPASVELS